MHIILNGKNDNWNYIGKWWLKKYDQIYNTEYSETQNEQSLEIFKKNVKTYLFRIAYYDLL
jgi:hypothetical protein